MRARITGIVVGCVLVGALGSVPATAGTAGDSPGRVRLVEVAQFDRPTAMAFRPDDPTIYVAEQTGRVFAVRDGVVLDRPVLNLREPVNVHYEQGILGMAFAPDGDRLYVHFTKTGNKSVVEEYVLVDDDKGRPRADPSTRRTLLSIGKTEPFHNGGQLAFSPDGYLYIGIGDGGDPSNSQSLDTLLGKILRIDPTPAGGRPYTIPPENPFAVGGGRPEICDWGLRNPWQSSFDAETGDLWIGDVGQDAQEEVDRLPAAEPCGANLGWPFLEGDQAYREAPAVGVTGKVVDPVAVRRHDDNNPRSPCAVIGGFVYRGTAIPELRGWYVFADLCDGRIRALPAGGEPPLGARSLGARTSSPVAFGQDHANELYVLACADCGSDDTHGHRAPNAIYRLTATRGL